MKIKISVVSWILTWSQLNFAHTKTAQLSWYMKNIVVIGLTWKKIINKIFKSKLNFYWHFVRVMGSKAAFCHSACCESLIKRAETQNRCGGISCQHWVWNSWKCKTERLKRCKTHENIKVIHCNQKDISPMKNTKLKQNHAIFLYHNWKYWSLSLLSLNKKHCISFSQNSFWVCISNKQWKWLLLFFWVHVKIIGMF